MVVIRAVSCGPRTERTKGLALGAAKREADLIGLRKAAVCTERVCPASFHGRHNDRLTSSSVTPILLHRARS